MVSVNKMRCFTLISGCRRCNAYAYKSHAPFRCFRSLQGANRKFAFPRRFTLISGCRRATCISPTRPFAAFAASGPLQAFAFPRR